MAAPQANLLDTHIVYWWMTDDRRLDRHLRRLVSRGDAVVSAASIWEMAIKNAKGKLPLPSSPIAEGLQNAGFRVLSITATHAEATRALPAAHPDPFDRLLLGTAICERMQLLTTDRALIDFARAYAPGCIGSYS
jgi:PIN domain nuclease of toxin-antitoxin system